MGRVLPDGNIEFRGRRDLQVKIQGFRVELAEIEAALAPYPAVEEVVVATWEAREGEKRLIAYFTTNAAPVPSSDELRRFLRDKLPGHMIPSTFVRLDALPLTPSGKLDRRALPVPGPARPEDALAVPRDGLERQLAEIWRSILEVERIGVRDDFFDLGGHSVLALRMMSAIEGRLGVNLPLATLFEAPTVEQLAEVLRAEASPRGSRAPLAVRPAGDRSPLFCVEGHLGELLCYRELSRRLGPEQPFFGLRDQAVAGRSPPRSIQAMAADNLARVRNVQTSGPYFLAGHCLGAVVAFEMAQQLVAGDQQVAVLALFWGPPPPAPLTARVRSHLERLQRLGMREKVAYLLEQARPTGVDDHLRAASGYAPRTYPGRMTVFLSGGSAAEARQDPRRHLAGMAANEVEVVDVPGDRDSMLREPFVQVLAEQLEAVLGRARVSTARPDS
jgi:thioesterase domain-containing protein/acyl carrier protein